MARSPLIRLVQQAQPPTSPQVQRALVVEQYGDGSLLVEAAGRRVLARRVTDEDVEAGQYVWLMRSSEQDFYVVGAA
jgi:hypothetical protein